LNVGAPALFSVSGGFYEASTLLRRRRRGWCLPYEPQLLVFQEPFWRNRV